MTSAFFFTKLRLGVSDDVISSAANLHNWAAPLFALGIKDAGFSTNVMVPKAASAAPASSAYGPPQRRTHIGDGCGEQRDIGGRERLFASLQHLERCSRAPRGRPRGQEWKPAVISVTSAPRRRAARAMAYPVLPLERWGDRRGSMGSTVGPAVS